MGGWIFHYKYPCMQRQWASKSRRKQEKLRESSCERKRKREIVRNPCVD
ncbi:hypothetical protein SLEP1_g551 [Rubroshorea leprosula]|uniref:Uncharacterized protein n=1 Tax=Rubroshorea leprosula TaxID=152421 RepID=A0AAV5HKB0_9ROSI|nr:hypothetical protein SLEP1_g551 [Rubroshorea leprosula]